MKKVSKNLFIFLLGILMAFTIIPFSANAADNSVNYWSYSEPSRTLYYTGGTTLKGNDVRWFQCAINNLIKNGDKNNKKLLSTSFLLEVDGSFGPASSKALKEFQKKYNLTVDGKFGPNSRSKMKSVLKPRTTVPVHTHSYSFQQRGNSLSAVCSCGYEEKAISYQRYLTLSGKSDSMNNFCVYLKKRGYTELANQYIKAGENANIFLYYHKKNLSDHYKQLTEQCDYMIKLEKTISYDYTDDDCIKIQVSTVEQMKDIWNNLLPKKFKNVHMFFHGGPGAVYFDQGDLTSSDISKLNYKTISGNLYLYSCYGGGSGNYNGSPMKAFRSICSAKQVVACSDSGVNYVGAAQDYSELVSSIIKGFQYYILNQYYPVRADAKNGMWISIDRNNNYKHTTYCPVVLYDTNRRVTL